MRGEAVLIFGSGSDSGQSASVSGDLLVLLSNIFASLGYVCGARLQQSGYPAQGTTYWGVVLASLLLLPFLPRYLGSVVWPAISVDVILSLLYLGIAVTVTGYIMWYWALAQGGIARIGLIQFFQPVTGIVFAWILLSETISAGFIFASSLVLAGVWLALRDNQR